MKNDMPARDFSKAKPANAVPALARMHKANANKKRITIRLDADVLAWFRNQVAGGGNYQSLINAALREHMDDAQTTNYSPLLCVGEGSKRGKAQTRAYSKPITAANFANTSSMMKGGTLSSLRPPRA